jgi:hypothetical protein
MVVPFLTELVPLNRYRSLKALMPARYHVPLCCLSDFIYCYAECRNADSWCPLYVIVRAQPRVRWLSIKAAFHRMSFSSNGRHFIECTNSSNFQNCKQNFCSTSTSKVINDLVRVTLQPITNNTPIWS